MSWLLWPIARTQFNMYNTDKTREIGNLKVNCLYHNGKHDSENSERIEYCLDLTDSENLLADDFLNTSDQNFTFDELYRMKVTADDLLSWSATIDLTEKYQYYLDHQHISSTSEEIFFNCTKPWFGSRCQYSFLLTTVYSFPRLFSNVLTKKFAGFPSSMIPSTCYMHLKCDRGGSGLCLDWREVCDGRIDCFNGGVDEAQCFDLEINECNETEYRCQNGLCIPKEFLKDDKPHCVDQTDKPDSYWRSQSNIPYIFRDVERSCRSSYQQFPCGDGKCVADFGTCKSQRHVFLSHSISRQGNLSYECWMTHDLSHQNS